MPSNASAQVTAPNGAYPFAGVVGDGAGNLYGTTTAGGSEDKGVVYKVDSAGQETVLYNFTGASDGGVPQGGVVLDAAGNLYGTTTVGGSSGRGVVYKLDPAGKETVLHTFTGGYDGSTPYAGLTIDANGNLYGTAYEGGVYGKGVLFLLDSSGNLTVIYSFMGGADGSNPYAGVFRDPAGNLYGTTAYGGVALMRCSHPPAGCGVVYKVDTTGHESVLHPFRAGADGAEPSAGVILDRQGNLYGTTFEGGTGSCTNGCGTIFRISPTGEETVVHNFEGTPDGEAPNSNLIIDARGNLYGTATEGGAFGAGAVYKVDPAGQFTVLHSFNSESTTGPDGFTPQSGVIFGASGNLFGTTEHGGLAQYGAAYKLESNGKEIILHCFTK